MAEVEPPRYPSFGTPQPSIFGAQTRALERALNATLDALQLSAVAPPVATPAPPAVALPSPPPPASLPAPPAPPTPTPTATPGPASGGWSYETYRGAAERAVRDTAKRRGATRAAERVLEGEILRRGVGAIGRGILGPIGGIIWGIVSPGELGTGEARPEDLEESLRKKRATEESILSQIGRDIFRGSAIGGAGIIIGGGVLKDVISRLPPPVPALPDLGRDEPRVVVEVPRVEIPAPRIPQPAPLPLPQPPAASIPTPKPTSSRPSSSPSSSRSPSPTAPPLPASTPMSWPALGSALGVFTRRSALTRPRTAPLNALQPAIATQPATSVSPISAIAPSVPIATAAPLASPLTGFNTAVLGSSPPRLRTRTRTRECDCQPKPRKPARKCRASASVVWAGGPNKGKIAGNRCYSFIGGK